MIEQPIKRFRVYCEIEGSTTDGRHKMAEQTRLYWEVCWYRTLTGMRRGYTAWAKSNRRKSISTKGTKAMTCCMRVISFEKGKKAYHNPCMGRMFLNHKNSGAGILAHECVHAAVMYFQEKHLTVEAKENEERFAYAVSEMVKQITARIW